MGAAGGRGCGGRTWRGEGSGWGGAYGCRAALRSEDGCGVAMATAPSSAAPGPQGGGRHPEPPPARIPHPKPPPPIPCPDRPIPISPSPRPPSSKRPQPQISLFPNPSQPHPLPSPPPTPQSLLPWTPPRYSHSRRFGSHPTAAAESRCGVGGADAGGQHPGPSGGGLSLCIPVPPPSPAAARGRAVSAGAGHELSGAGGTGWHRGGHTWGGGTHGEGDATGTAESVKAQGWGAQRIAVGGGVGAPDPRSAGGSPTPPRSLPDRASPLNMQIAPLPARHI